LRTFNFAFYNYILKKFNICYGLFYDGLRKSDFVPSNVKFIDKREMEIILKK